MSANDNTAALGVSLPGVDLAAARAAVAPVAELEVAVARNLRQPSSCGKDWIRRLIDGTEPGAEDALAKLVADSGTRHIRENEAVMRAQLQAAADNAERYRRALETLASNAHIAPAEYPRELRDILIAALGRPY